MLNKRIAVLTGLIMGSSVTRVTKTQEKNPVKFITNSQWQ